eukprot:XP_001698445.1 predicted protein [Chlamydomonas reinhardtii]
MEGGAAGSSSAPADSGRLHVWLHSKLSGDWSAQTAASGLNEERLNALVRTFGGLDSMVKVRLLLAGLFVPRADRPRLVPLLAELSSGAAGSQDEWVRATAAAVGDWAGPLDTAALAAQFPLVRDTVAGLQSELQSLGPHTPAALLPQTVPSTPSGGAAKPGVSGAAVSLSVSVSGSGGGAMRSGSLGLTLSRGRSLRQHRAVRRAAIGSGCVPVRAGTYRKRP